MLVFSARPAVDGGNSVPFVDESDAAGNETDDVFDSNGNLLSTEGPAVTVGPTTLGGETSTARPTTAYTYNGDSQVLTQTGAQ